MKSNNIPIGKVKYEKLIGTSRKLLRPTSPIAWFFAKLKRVESPLKPNFWKEKNKLIPVGIKPINIPEQKQILKEKSFLNKL